MTRHAERVAKSAGEAIIKLAQDGRISNTQLGWYFRGQRLSDYDRHEVAQVLVCALLMCSIDLDGYPDPLVESMIGEAYLP